MLSFKVNHETLRLPSNQYPESVVAEADALSRPHPANDFSAQALFWTSCVHMRCMLVRVYTCCGYGNTTPSSGQGNLPIVHNTGGSYIVGKVRAPYALHGMYTIYSLSLSECVRLWTGVVSHIPHHNRVEAATSLSSFEIPYSIVLGVPCRYPSYQSNFVTATRPRDQTQDQYRLPRFATCSQAC